LGLKAHTNCCLQWQVRRKLNILAEDKAALALEDGQLLAGEATDAVHQHLRHMQAQRTKNDHLLALAEQRVHRRLATAPGLDL
jgi:hypothetical protein